MKKVIISIVLIALALLITYLTFMIAVIKIKIGAVLLGICVVALIAAWITWKLKKD